MISPVPPRKRFPAIRPPRFRMIRLLAACHVLGVSAAAFDGWQLGSRTGATWHDNVTNADRAEDRLVAFELAQDITAARRWSAGRNGAVFAGARARIEAWPRYDGLDRAAFGLRLGWQQKTGLGAHTPVLAVDLSADRFAAREIGRAGRAGALTATVRRRFSHWALVRLGYEWSRYDAREHAFDRTARESFVSLAADLNGGWRVTAALARRDGGVISYARPPHPILLAGGKALTTVGTFDADRDFVAYYFMARTVSARAELSRALDARTAVALAGEIRETNRGVVAYPNRVLSLTLLRDF
jgi:hypothetical protein